MQTLINYIEMPSTDMAATKAFFERAFGWSFTDYGPDYSDFSQSGIDGGFFRAEHSMSQDRGSALVVLYSDDLAASQAAVVEAGGSISKPTFSFPGGSRFHFIEPSGNEFAVWTKA